VILSFFPRKTVTKREKQLRSGVRLEKQLRAELGPKNDYGSEVGERESYPVPGGSGRKAPKMEHSLGAILDPAAPARRKPMVTLLWFGIKGLIKPTGPNRRP
jgi:hypothetical protein